MKVPSKPHTSIKMIFSRSFYEKSEILYHDQVVLDVVGAPFLLDQMLCQVVVDSTFCRWSS